MAKKEISNEKALRNGLKAVENLGILAPAILRERLLTLININIIQIKEDTEPYNTPVFNSDQFLEVLETFKNELKF